MKEHFKLTNVVSNQNNEITLNNFKKRYNDFSYSSIRRFKQWIYTLSWLKNKLILRENTKRMWVIRH